MAKYRKKPVIIDAVPAAELIHNAERDWKALPDWIKEAYDKGSIYFCPAYINITTLEGTMKAEKEDMVIRGVQGEIYPCKPEIFNATYEKVTDQ